MLHAPVMKERFLALRAEGLSFDKIARELQVSKHTLLAWSHELQRELAALRALRLEHLQAESEARHEQTMALLAAQMKRVLDELAQRNLSDLPTPKLFDLVLRHIATIAKQETDARRNLEAFELPILDAPAPTEPAAEAPAEPRPADPGPARTTTAPKIDPVKEMDDLLGALSGARPSSPVAPADPSDSAARIREKMYRKRAKRF